MDKASAWRRKSRTREKIKFVVENVNREAGPKQKKEKQDNLRMINEKITLQQALLAYQDETHLFGFMMFFSLDKLMLIDRE